jgi:hypothetical protein
MVESFYKDSKLQSSVQHRIIVLALTVSIRIVTDCGLQTCQAAQKMKQAKTFDFTTVSAIIFIHCCAFVILII